MGPSHPWRPKIVLATPYYRPVVGGLTTFVAGLEHELVRHGAEVTVLTRDGAEALACIRAQRTHRRLSGGADG